MEAPRHWRMRKDRYNLRGEKRELEDGTVQLKINGSTTWTEPHPNGHHEGESPFKAVIIYQAPRKDYANGLEPIPIGAGVEISVSAD